MNKIEPKILKGTRDFLPNQMAKRNLVMNKIRSIFERFGYGNIETPTISLAETILGKYGDEGDQLTYSFEDNGGRKLALPYDQTVPFARLFAANWGKLPLPFKRYQMQKVWRADKPQRGRYREFYQCDVDIIGTRSLVCEAELAKVMVTVFEELGFDEFTIKFNSRRLLNDVLEAYQVPADKRTNAIQAIDKLAKIGVEAVVEILEKLNVQNAKELMQLLSPGEDNSSTLRNLERFDLGEIEEFMQNCEAMGASEQYLQFDPSLARGLDYYTGLNFEVYCADKDLGAICAGGRYDDLCSMFCNQEFSGVGVAFGFDRIVMALDQMGKLDEIDASAQVMVVVFDDESKAESLRLYSELIEAGVCSEIYFEAAKLSKQLKYADRKNIPFVAIAGTEEIENQEVVIKNMKTGKQKNIPRNQLISYLTNYYEGADSNSK